MVKKQKVMSLLLMVCILATRSLFLEAQEMNELWGNNSIVKESKRGKYFADGNYCMFIHWGLYSHIANKWNGKTYYGIGEWIMNPQMANISIDEYKQWQISSIPEFDA